MIEPDHDEPRFYLEDSRPIGGKTQWRRSKQSYASIEAAKQAQARGNVTWGPWSNQPYRKTEVPRGERMKRTKNWVG